MLSVRIPAPQPGSVACSPARYVLSRRWALRMMATMGKIASGHMAFWEGGSLWVFDVPFATEGPDRTDVHAHHAYQMTLSLGGEFSLQLNDCILTSPAALVAPDTSHSMKASGLIGLLFVEPESRAGRNLARLMGGQPGLALSVDEVGDAPGLISRAIGNSSGRGSALREVGMTLTRRAAGDISDIQLDRRVRLMIDWANRNFRLSKGVREAADAVGLSASRASHLFVEQTGLPFRTYLLWLRLTRAVDAYTAGINLTEAAQEAGFADSAHLSRTFRRMFGVSAASLEIS